jgi:thiol-disulfide isomerase/thioredoxin
MKKILILSSILIVAIIGAGYYVATNKSEPATTQLSTNDKTSEDESTPAPESTPEATVASNPGTYIDYSEDKVAAASGTKLLFFHAPWCPQCRQLDESITNSKLPENTTIFKVDYDSNQSLRQKYGVTIQTTVVKIDVAGNKIDSYVAYQSPTFANVRAALLE